jgi:serine phosphatase RsbU (regulator of sigma subunit)
MNYTSEILNQKNELHLKNQEISDSLFYARNIQRSILKFDPSIEKAFADSFLLFKPKDVVSGDFFWIHEEDEKIIGCVADCTGHGVPGALMSMIGITLLRESVIEKKMFDPSSILERIRNGIIQILKQTEEPSGSKDGMDISLCVYDKTSKILNYSGANNDCYVIRGSEIIELKAAKLPIGIYPGEEQSFHSITMQLEKNDSIFMFTDGFADQFGGPAGKKFKKKNLLSMILKNSSLPLKQQKKLLEEEFHRWKEQFEQTDDITIFGVRV